MISYKKHSRSQIEDFLLSQEKLEFTYSDLGASRNATNKAPAGFVVDHNRTQIGEGEQDFESAKEALRNWKHFQFGWVEPCWPETPIEEGQIVGILATWCNLWFLNACRIVYCVDERMECKERFGFAYGTLPGHAECGEELFQVELDHDTGEVHYEIRAFSRPHRWFAKLGYPLVRKLQKRFAQDSTESLRAVVS